jgi:plastocyanin
MRAFTAAAAFVAAAVAGFAACGGGSTPAPAPTPSGPMTINIVGERGSTSFSPNPALAAGRVVVFRNNDSIVHRVRLNDLSIDTGDIPPGGTSRQVTMPALGTNYHCLLHPTMIGAVGAPNNEPPPCTGVYC